MGAIIQYDRMASVTKEYFNSMFDEQRNVQRVDQVLATSFKVKSTGIAFQNGRSDFLAGLQRQHFENISGSVTRIKENDSPGDKPNTIQWEIECMQNRLGKGLHESQPGNYQVYATCIFTIVEENGECKIGKLKQLNYGKNLQT